MGDPSVATTTLASLNNLVVFAQDEGFIGSTLFFVLGAVIVLALGGLLYYLRNKQED